MAVVQLALSRPTQADVEIAWATYRTLIIAEVDDPALQEDETHQGAIRLAKARFTRLYDEWAS
jgi:hypothetical protein